MTAASAVPALIDALVAVANTAFPDATSLVDVNDGPANTQEDTGQALWIGSNGDDQSTEGATADQEWPYASNGFRRETLTVHCLALAWSGDDDFKTVRDQAFAQVQAFTAAIVTDPTLGGVVLQCTTPVNRISLAQGFNNLSGVEARVSFDVEALNQTQG